MVSHLIVSPRVFFSCLFSSWFSSFIHATEIPVIAQGIRSVPWNSAGRPGWKQCKTVLSRFGKAEERRGLHGRVLIYGKSVHGIQMNLGMDWLGFIKINYNYTIWYPHKIIVYLHIFSSRNWDYTYTWFIIVIILLNGQYPTGLHSVAKWNDASKKVAGCKLLCFKILKRLAGAHRAHPSFWRCPKKIWNSSFQLIPSGNLT